MASAEKHKSELISGIETDARAEVEQIIQEAETQAAEKRKYGQKKAESLLSSAKEKADEQAEAAKRKIISGVELEVRRRAMRIRDDVIQSIMDRAVERLGTMVEDPQYRGVLKHWIAEAAVGLDAESAEVNASEPERRLIDEQLLGEAADEVRQKTGRNVTLRLSEAQPLQGQGVVLTAADGRTAFNNQVKTRMLRQQREIRTLIYDSLFTES